MIRQSSGLSAEWHSRFPFPVAIRRFLQKNVCIGSHRGADRGVCGKNGDVLQLCRIMCCRGKSKFSEKSPKCGEELQKLRTPSHLGAPEWGGIKKTT